MSNQNRRSSSSGARSNDPLFRTAGTSRAQLVKPAVRVRLPARIMVSGQPSAGKTQSSLDMAQHLIDQYRRLLPQLGEGQVYVVDTEVANGDGMAVSSQNFADGRSFSVIPFAAPYHPLDLIATLDDLARVTRECDVVVVDSMTHFWHGEQGILSLVGHNGSKSTFNRWNPAREFQTQLYERIKSMPCHVILACRAKEKNQRTEDDDGATTIVPLGIQPMQDADMPYEVTISLMLDRTTHAITVDKCNAPIGLQGSTFGADKHGEFIETYAEWLAAGGELIGREFLDRIDAAFATIPETDPEQPRRRPRVEAKQAFMDEFGGAPQTVRADQAERALEWVTETAERAIAGLAVVNMDPDDEVWGPPTEPSRVMVRGGFVIEEIPDPDDEQAPVFRATDPETNTSAIGTTVDAAIAQLRPASQPAHDDAPSDGPDSPSETPQAVPDAPGPDPEDSDADGDDAPVDLRATRLLRLMGSSNPQDRYPKTYKQAPLAAEDDALELED